MRRVGLFALGLLMLLSSAGWSDDFIRYHAGVAGLTSSATAITSTVPILFPNGSAAAPSISFTNQTDMGLYYSGANTIGIATNGVKQWDIVNGAFVPSANNVRDLGAVGIYLKRVYTVQIQGSASKTLTDAAAAVSFAVIPVATNGQVAGEMIWTATSSAAAVRFVANGSVRWWGVDEGGTPVCGINKIGTDGEGHSSGANTLVCTITNAVSTTNCALQVTCTNDTAGTDPITFYGRLDIPTAVTPVFP